MIQELDSPNQASARCLSMTPTEKAYIADWMWASFDYREF